MEQTMHFTRYKLALRVLQIKTENVFLTISKWLMCFYLAVNQQIGTSLPHLVGSPLDLRYQ